MLKQTATVAALIVTPGLLFAGAAPATQKDISTNPIGDSEISSSASAWSIFESQNPGVGKEIIRRCTTFTGVRLFFNGTRGSAIYCC